MAEVSQCLPSPELVQVQLVILLFIDPPLAPHPMLPRISLQLWKVSSAAQQEREAQMVWDADWTNSATPLYIYYFLTSSDNKCLMPMVTVIVCT